MSDREPMEPKDTTHALTNPPIMDIENVASSYDCTGLIPAAVADKDEAEHYSHLYAIHEQKLYRPLKPRD